MILQNQFSQNHLGQNDGGKNVPIEIQGGPLRVFSQDEFHELDHAVMAITFRVHNQFGRLLDELLYKREIAARCAESAIPTEREVRIWVTHGSFTKEYAIDLVFSHGVIFEAKAVEWLAPAHEAQALNYLLLTGTHHAKLINLRPERVQWRFVSTKLTPELRRCITVDDSAWRGVNAPSQRLKEIMIELLRDWGAFLECGLYREALTHFLGGQEAVVRRIPVYSDEHAIGEQDVHLLSEDTAFAVSAVTESTDGMRTHLGRFLAHTHLQHLQWVNLNHHRIEFVTLSK
jgi:GxxExxY protein